jgi:LacI family transcriptional regulator
MADVARVAGVHVSTVSLALRNHPSLPPETRERIQEIAGRMGYRPDPALSALMAMRKKTRSRGGPAPIAYITNWGSEFGWKEHPAHAQFHSGASARALKLGYRLEHFWLGEPGMSERRLNSILRARGIAGIISASHQQDSSMAGTFEWKDFSAVKIDYFPSEPALHLVTNDQRCISQMAMHHVIDAGYRRIGLVMPKWWDEYADRTWSAGFLARQRSLPTGDQVPIFEYDLPVFPAPAAELGRWLERYQPEVIISYSPFVLPPLAELGLSVPRDIAFVDTFLTASNGQIAGVRQNCVRVGELAVEILVGQLLQNIKGIPEFPTATFVEGTWSDGASLPARH